VVSHKGLACKLVLGLGYVDVRRQRTELESPVVFLVHGSDAVMAVLVAGKRRPLESRLGRVSEGRASMVSRRRHPWKLVSPVVPSASYDEGGKLLVLVDHKDATKKP